MAAPPLSHPGHTLGRRVAWSMAALVAGGVVAVAAVARLFLDVPLSELLGFGPELATCFGVAGLLSALVLTRLLHRVSAHLDAGGRAPERVIGALLLLQALPYRTAMLTFAFWTVAAGGATLVWLTVEAGDLYTGMMILIGAVIVAVGLALVQISWHKRIVAPFAATLLRSDRAVLERAVTRRYTIRFKISLTLGGLIFFACAIALFTSFAQQQDLVLHLLAGEASERLAQREPLVRSSNTPEELCSALARPDAALAAHGALGPSEREVLVVFDEERLYCSVPEGALTAKSLPGLVTDIGGPIRLLRPDLTGASAPAPQGARVASLLEKPPRLTHNIRLSLVFFTLLFLFSGALVITMSRDITVPINALTREVLAVTKHGPLGDGPEVAAVPFEPDEIGTLTVAFQRMREALADQIGTIRELNRTLEEKVRARTRALEESQAHLVHSEKMASLGGLVAGVAHEINNPLNTIVNNVAPLRERIEALRGALADPDGEAAEDLAEALEILDVMADGGDRTKTIVQALKTFSHAGEAEWKDTSLAEAVQCTLSLLAFQLKGGIEVRTELTEVGPVRCDASAINQVILNLVTNAIDAVQGKPEGERRIRVAIGEAAGQAYVEVEDSGAGIASERLSRIFEPFYTTKEVGKGTGLGLSIAHGIVQRHRGSIEVESRLGEGSTFRMRLPTLAASGPERQPPSSNGS